MFAFTRTVSRARSHHWPLASGYPKAAALAVLAVTAWFALGAPAPAVLEAAGSARVAETRNADAFRLAASERPAAPRPPVADLSGGPKLISLDHSKVAFAMETQSAIHDAMSRVIGRWPGSAFNQPRAGAPPTGPAALCACVPCSGPAGA